MKLQDFVNKGITVKSMVENLEQDTDINIDTKIKLKSKLKEIVSLLDVTKSE